MRTWTPILALVLVLLSGCVYKAPVTTNHTIPVDPAVLGMWQAVPEPGKDLDTDERMLVLKYSDTEYMVRYPSGKDAMFFRGYPIKVGNLQCVQIQLIGEKDQPVNDEDRKYQIVAYKLTDGVLELRTLNADLVSDRLATSADLLKAIKANVANPDLFKDPGKFKKLVKE
jgi:hypothetical protein